MGAAAAAAAAAVFVSWGVSKVASPVINACESIGLGVWGLMEAGILWGCGEGEIEAGCSKC